MVKKSGTIVQPFRRRFNRDDDEVFDFMFVSTRTGDTYITEITIDELNDFLVTKVDCECKDYIIRRRDCKHIKEALKQLTFFKIEWRQE